MFSLSTWVKLAYYALHDDETLSESGPLKMKDIEKAKIEYKSKRLENDQGAAFGERLALIVKHEIWLTFFECFG